jgi:methylated-DNA-[protein]-cysteine S-methyltransferase
MTSTHTLNSPLGPLTLESEDGVLTKLTIGKSGQKVEETTNPSLAIFQEATTQLGEYFAGTRASFDLAISWAGTPFQESVWKALRAIPYGTSVGYQELGEQAGVGRAPRAVGGAVGANPLPIIVPCHRVLSKQKTITGYSGGEGIPTKVALLELEGIYYR